MKRILLTAALCAALPSMAPAGVIERACLRADRPAATSALCGCIQRVADARLTRRDQRKASRFFADPHRAQETRQSDRPSNEVFWKKYKAFAASAQRACG